MTEVEQLAHFVVTRSWDDLAEATRGELKLGALDASPVPAIRAQLEGFDRHEDEA
ncbi:MAG TPA: hypothetical protein VFU64_02645 [Gaiellaceae bacterium]|nr:hypothetical protein [Gaiellaceae bacterium]